ncbi:glycosyl transferase, family 2 [Pyrobaculum islandicum DSM 4184]|uniref:Glycosyl transferase, family 2 n=1 Tax=Pyrobaculum islandicum (strain DSM 4184 / JCM 9189 / GEO3) TaxID=384616 RepID=A1RS69_PYRIL|nr:glycosyltransferase family 2 protein [Pyrobaculum islandicum]ABL87801.1 glycosyl transferase, family 2 [Pyrobaculum islandicum DSM 4184]
MVESILFAPFIVLALAGLMREYLFWRNETASHRQSCRKISVIIPMRGVYSWTEDNLRAITSQKTDVEIEYIFVVDSPEDPAYVLAQKFGRVIISQGEGKSAALATGLKVAKGDCIVFADDDIKPRENWLESLTAPLSLYTAVTTYRWYVGQGLCHKVKLAISNMGFPAMMDKRSRFVWGGSTAFKREFAERVKLAERLPKYISDDYAVYSAIKEVGGTIWFAKSAIAPTPDPQCKIQEAFHWGVRQILMVKWHARLGWYIGLMIYTLGFFISVVLPIVGVLIRNYWLLPGLALHPINLAKDFIRARGVKKYTAIQVSVVDIVATWAIGNFIIPTALWVSVFTKCINWRGRKICR